MRMEIQNIDFQKSINKCNIDELPTLVASTSPPSSSSNSPAHEFSFTISFNQHPSNTISNNKSAINSPHHVAAVDLSPADDIFFHGHLLPLHLLSHLPVSPRSSTNSLDSFTLPITEFYLDDHDQIIEENNTNDDIEYTTFEQLNDTTTTATATTRGSRSVKSKSFSIFGGRKKGSERQEQERQKKKLKSEVSDVLKKYMRMLRPLLTFRGSRKSINKPFHNQSYSYPGSVSSRKKQDDEFRGRRGLFSAPASMRTSPTNSGLLIATGAAAACSTSSSDSTMEELQAAIQSAITHCKNSIAVQEKIKCQDI